MRIRTQLFLSIAALLVALVGVQWWLHMRQLRAIEREVAAVATNVGARIILNDFVARQDDDVVIQTPSIPETKDAANESQQKRVVMIRRRSVALSSVVENAGSGQDAGRKKSNETMERTDELISSADQKTFDGLSENPVRIRLEPSGDASDRLLVISGLPSGEQRIPVPISRSAQIVQSTFQQQLLAGSLLLVVGFTAAGMFAHRITSPLRRLSNGVEALGRGELGVQVATPAKGEIGELQAAFNRMSLRLAQLENEKKSWEARKHLAELGDLARGLGHTLRNPLNTLGLVVEELACQRDGEGQDLAAVARGQIRRIDGWLRSFLALGAGRAATPEPVDLRDIIHDVTLEVVQSGRAVSIEAGAESLRAVVVKPALSAALSSLVNNAVEASPPEMGTLVTLKKEGDQAVICVRDYGPGIPPEVSAKLFTPHVTTKAGGSGMGLFLAKQLMDGTGGALVISNVADGGALAQLFIPLIQEVSK